MTMPPEAAQVLSSQLKGLQECDSADILHREHNIRALSPFQVSQLLENAGCLD